MGTDSRSRQQKQPFGAGTQLMPQAPLYLFHQLFSFFERCSMHHYRPYSVRRPLSGSIGVNTCMIPFLKVPSALFASATRIRLPKLFMKR